MYAPGGSGSVMSDGDYIAALNREAMVERAKREDAEAAARDLWAALDGITDHDPTEQDGKPWIDAHAALSKWREFA